VSPERKNILFSGSGESILACGEGAKRVKPAHNDNPIFLQNFAVTLRFSKGFALEVGLTLCLCGESFI
jgi:hypothetical protein